MSEATYYQWKSKYGGMQASDIKRLRESEEENRRLKQIAPSVGLDPAEAPAKSLVRLIFRN